MRWLADRSARSLALGLVGALSLIIPGCIPGTGHSRPSGQGDLTYAIAPDGASLVFNAVGTGEKDLYLLDLKTLQVRAVAATPDYEVDPDFAPDGKSLVYAAGVPGDKADHIFVRSLEGKTVTQLTREPSNDAEPAFSPDGSLITFTRDKTYQWGGLASNWDNGVLCVMRADGTGFRQLTPDNSPASSPHFAPDGRTILYIGEEGMTTVPADGSGPSQPLAESSGSYPAYAPDGKTIAFADGRYSPDHRIFLAQADGTKRQKLATLGQPSPKPPGLGCYQPHFLPDGQHFLCLVESWPGGPTQDSKQSLWESDLTGTRTREVASYRLFDDPLDWQPPGPVPTPQP